MAATVSVVIPVFERPAAICRALASVMDQSARPFEVIVVNDGSSDDTADQVRSRYPEVTLLDSCAPPDNAGVSRSRNRGIDAADGDWIALLDSDDLWMPDKLSKQMSLANEHPDARVIHTNEIWIRNGERVNQGDRHVKRGGWVYHDCLPLCAISPSSVMIHRDVFDTVGNFDESLPACEDYDLWLRITARYPVHFIDEPLVTKHGGHIDQLSRKYPAMDRFRIQALEKILESGVLDEDDQSATVDVLLAKAAIYQAGVVKRGRLDEAGRLAALIEHWSATP